MRMKYSIFTFQILLIIPVLWITVALFMYSERGNGAGGTGSGSGSGPSGGVDSGGGGAAGAVRSRGARRDLSENVNRDGPKSGNMDFFQISKMKNFIC